MSSSSSTLDAYAALRNCGPGTRGGQYLRRFWHPIARVDDLAPATLQPLWVLGAQRLLVRFADGTHVLWDDRCPHRGVPLSLGAVFDQTVRCPYHGWRFDSRGHNVHAPGEPENRCTAARAAAHPLARAFGLLFAWLGDGPPAPFPFADVEPAEMVPYRLAPIEWPTHFLLRMENTTDFSHLQGTHVASGLAAWLPPDYRQVYASQPRGHQLHLVAESDPHGLLHGMALGHPMTWQMPHFFHYRQPLFEGEPWRQHLTWHTPATDALTRTFTVALVPRSTLERDDRAEPGGPSHDIVDRAEDVLAGRVTLEGLRGHPNLTEIEDCVMVVAQHRAGGSLASVLGQTDVGVASLRQKLGRDPSIDEVASDLDIEPDEMREWEQAFQANVHQSLDNVYDEFSIWFVSSENTPEDNISDNELRNVLKEALTTLPEREAMVIQLYYVEELNVYEIAEILEVTTGRVSQIKKAAIARLRGFMEQVDHQEAISG